MLQSLDSGRVSTQHVSAIILDRERRVLTLMTVGGPIGNAAQSTTAGIGKTVSGTASGLGKTVGDTASGIGNYDVSKTAAGATGGVGKTVCSPCRIRTLMSC